MDKSEIAQFLDVPGLTGLNRDEKAGIEEFLKNPGKDEFFFLLQLLGKTPAQIRNMMIDEFIRRFNLMAHAEEIGKAFASKRSWHELDVVMASFGGSMEVEEHRLFWDRMRYVLAALPKRKDYGEKYQHEDKDKAAKPKRERRFTTCKLCWRRVSHNSGLIRKTEVRPASRPEIDDLKENNPTHPLRRGASVKFWRA